MIHGDIVQAQREKTLQGFRDGIFSILVATDVAARGLDIEGVDLVIQMYPKLPEDLEAYVHRSGRTGRAGKTGTNISFFKNEAGLSVLQKHLKTPIKMIGPPQPADMYKSGAEKAIEDICQVNEGQVTNFLQYSSDLLERYKALKKGQKSEEATNIGGPKISLGLGEDEEDEYENEREGRDEDVESIDEEIEETEIDREKDYQLTLELLSRALAVITGHTQMAQRRSLLSCELGYTTIHFTSKSPINTRHYAIGVVSRNTGVDESKIKDVRVRIYFFNSF